MKGNCSVKNHNAWTLILQLEVLVSSATLVVILEHRRDTHACLAAATRVQREGPEMLLGCPGGPNAEWCPVGAAGRGAGGQSHSPATKAGWLQERCDVVTTVLTCVFSEEAVFVRTQQE